MAIVMAQAKEVSLRIILAWIGFVAAHQM